MPLVILLGLGIPGNGLLAKTKEHKAGCTQAYAIYLVALEVRSTPNISNMLHGLPIQSCPAGIPASGHAAFLRYLSILHCPVYELI